MASVKILTLQSGQYEEAAVGDTLNVPSTIQAISGDAIAWSGENFTGVGAITSSGTVQGSTLTDGMAALTGGALTGITNITLNGTLSDGNYTFDTSGNVSGLGTVGCEAITSTGTSSFSTAVKTAAIQFTDGDVALTIINNGHITTGGNLTVGGDLTVQGDTTTVESTTLSVKDPLIILASGNNSADVIDIGFYGLHDTSGSLDLYSGLFRDASDSGKWKLFKDNQEEPSATVNVSGTGYAVATLVANLEGAVTGNAATATVLANARNIGGVSFNGSTDINLPGVNSSGNQDTSGLAATATVLANARSIGGVSFNGSTDINLPGVNSSGNQDTSGLAATATVLANARNIGGVSFNGGANINLPGVNSAGNQDTSGLAATATKIASITNSNIVQLTAAQTLTSKTLTEAKIANGGFLADANGNESLQFGTTAAAINHLMIENAAQGSSPILRSTGSDTDVGMNFGLKAAGAMWVLLGNTTTSAFAIKDSAGQSQLSITADGEISGTVIDNGALGSSTTLLATQGAIKTYVDAVGRSAYSTSLAEELTNGSSNANLQFVVGVVYTNSNPDRNIRKATYTDAALDYSDAIGVVATSSTKAVGTTVTVASEGIITVHSNSFHGGTAPAATTIGDTVWGSPDTAGKMTLTAPTGANVVSQKLGKIVFAAGNDATKILLRIEAPIKLAS